MTASPSVTAKRAAGAEIVLHVDDEEGVIGSDVHSLSIQNISVHRITWTARNNRRSFGFASG